MTPDPVTEEVKRMIGDLVIQIATLRAEVAALRQAQAEKVAP